MSGTEILALLTNPSPFQEFYAEELRGSLFDGCLTFGGFLLAAYTFIVIHMKQAVYDTPQYTKTFEEKREADGRLKKFDPLRRMSRSLFRAVVVTLVAAILQLTLGLVPSSAAAAICLIDALAAVWVVFVSMKLMAENLRSWFAMLD